MAGDRALTLLIDIKSRDSASGIVRMLGGLFTGLAASLGKIGQSFQLFAMGAPITAMKALEQGIKGVIVAGLELAGLLALVGAAIAIALGVIAVRAAANFQQGLNRLVTGAGDVTDNMQKMGQSILSTSIATGVLTDQLLPAMYQIISAGQRGAEAENTLAVATRGAVIEQANATDTAKALTTAMTDYGTKTFNATQFMNGYIKAVQLGKLTLEELATAMSPILPIAENLGVSFADVAAAMSTITNAGVPALRAATSLRFMFQSLENPTKKATAAMVAMGLSTVAVANEMKISLPGALQMIYDAAKRAGPEGSVPFNRAVSDMIGGQRSLQAFLSLTGGHFATYVEDTKKITAAMKASRDAVLGWDTAQKNLNMKLSQAWSAIQAVFMAIGTQLLPKLGPVADAVASVAQHFADWVNNAQPISGLLDTIAGAIATVWPPAKQVNAALAPMADSFDRATGAMKSIPSHAKPMLDTFDRATSVIKTTHKDAVNPLVVALQWLATAWDKVKTAAIAVYNFLKPIALFIAAQLAPWIQMLGDIIQHYIVPAWNQFLAAIQPIMPQLKIVAEIIGIAVVGALLLVGIVILGAIAIIGLLVAGILWLASRFAVMVKSVVDLGTLWQNTWAAIGVFFANLWHGIERAALEGVHGILYVLSLIPGPIGDMARNAMKSIDNMISNIDASMKTLPPKVTSHMDHMKQQATEIAREMADAIAGHSIIPDMVTNIGNSFAKLPGLASQWFTSLKTTILTIINSLPGLLYQAGLKMIQQLAAGIQAGIGAVVQAVTNVANAVAAHLKHSTPVTGPLRGDDLWGLHFAMNIASGILAGIPAVAAMAALLASAMGGSYGYQVGGPTSAYPTGGGGSSVIIINNYLPSIKMDGREVTDGVMKRVAKEYRVTGPVKNN